jgi:outer membrane lipoprotein SlyB
MKKMAVFTLLMILPLSSFGQGQSLASTLDVYVFPSSGQEASQQSQDEAACYDWAVTNSGNDPFDLANQEEANQQQAQQEMADSQTSVRGSGVQSGLRGAAAGAVVGEIVSDDAGKGAAYGAAAGAIAGRRRTRQANEQAEQQAYQNAEVRQEATAEDQENFKKAFSVCLEAKEYMVKY